MDKVLDIVLHVARAFDRLNIPYLVGGSLASSLHGLPRATQDADMVADIQSDHVDPLVQALEDAFFIDAPMIRDALTHHGSFNVIHLETMFKIDIFIPSGDDVSMMEMSRRHAYAVTDDPPEELMVASAEDIVLQKLYWYKLGDEVSDRQWLDILGVLKVRHKDLDRDYLERMAVRMQVSALLKRAYADAGLTFER